MKPKPGSNQGVMMLPAVALGMLVAVMHPAYAANDNALPGVEGQSLQMVHAEMTSVPGEIDQMRAAPPALANLCDLALQLDAPFVGVPRAFRDLITTRVACADALLQSLEQSLQLLLDEHEEILGESLAVAMERLDTLASDAEVLEQLALSAVSALPEGDLEVTPDLLSSSLHVVLVDLELLGDALRSVSEVAAYANLRLQMTMARLEKLMATFSNMLQLVARMGEVITRNQK